MNFENVETFIASGNVIFETKSKNVKAIKTKIETELKKSLGYDVAAFIRTTDELKEISEYRPFKKFDSENEHNSIYIAFLENHPSKESQQKVFQHQNDYNAFHFNKNEMYWLCRKNFSDSGINLKKFCE